MARKGRQDRGLFERLAHSGVYWIRYAGPDGREHMEHGGTKSEARALYMRRRTEIHDGTWKSPRDAALRDPVQLTLRRAERLLRSATSRAPGSKSARRISPRLSSTTTSSCLRATCRTCARKPPLAEVNDGDISRLIKDISERKSRRGKPLSPRRINMVIARLRTIFATAHRRKLIADDPMHTSRTCASPSLTLTRSILARRFESSRPRTAGSVPSLRC